MPFDCFLVGGVGVGKSIVATALYQATIRFYAKDCQNAPMKLKQCKFCIHANQSLKFKPLQLDAEQLDTLQVEFSIYEGDFHR